MKRTLVAVALVVIFTLALALPAAAFEHEATYKWDGSITFSQQAGHFCNTGAEMQQRISGHGSMTKAKSVYMEEGVITVSDTNDWVTAPDAIRNLTVTTAIMLCAPAKHVYEGYAYNPDWLGGTDAFYGTIAAALEDPTLLGTILAALGFDDADELAQFLGFPDENYLAEISTDDAISDQIWAVQVAADPGYSGNLHMGFEAAYSGNVYPVTSKATVAAIADALGTPEPWNSSWFRTPFDDYPGKWAQSMGPWYAGNYFAIEQYSRTSMGTHRRYIDISSPWGHAYMSQDMTVRGMSEVWESFSMGNLAAGDEVGQLWWDLF